MVGFQTMKTATLALAAAALLAGCGTGMASKGSFDRTYTVNGPIRLELANASGAVRITGTSENTVRIHGEVRARSFFFNDPDKQARELSANPPIEQKPDIIRIGKELSKLSNASIDYTIEVPRNCEVTTTVASGAQTISNVQGPVRVESAAGSIAVSRIEHSVQVTSASGSVTAQDLDDDFRANTVSGSVSATNIKGDVRIRAISGSTNISRPGARVEASTTSGTVELNGASNDVTASSVSGRVSVQGNPSGNSYWSLKTTSGMVEVAVPASANFHLSAEAVSGEIRTGIPIVIEDQDKHSLRARVGSAGGRVEIHTVSGGIRLEPAS
jgi:Putative adhesin